MWLSGLAQKHGAGNSGLSNGLQNSDPSRAFPWGQRWSRTTCPVFLCLPSVVFLSLLDLVRGWTFLPLSVASQQRTWLPLRLLTVRSFSCSDVWKMTVCTTYKGHLSPPRRVGLALRLATVWEGSGAVFSGSDIINNIVYAVSTFLGLCLCRP